MESVLSLRQIEDWMLFAEIEPFGGPTEDYRAALAAWATIAATPGRKRPPKLADFMPKWGPPDPVDPAEYAARHRAVIAAAWQGN